MKGAADTLKLKMAIPEIPDAVLPLVMMANTYLNFLPTVEAVCHQRGFSKSKDQSRLSKN